MAIIRDYLVYNLFTNMPQVSLEIYRDRQFLKQLFGMALYEHPYLFSYPLTHMGAPNDCDYMINQVSFKEGVFDKHGKWMDGWETRRKRSKGYDYLILKFGKPGVIRKVDVDTSYFSGNHPDLISLQACISKKKIPDKKTKWITIIKKSRTKANSHHFFKVKNKNYFTHLKLNIFPDGGVARLRVYGSMKTKNKINNKIQNLTSVVNGAVPIACNNEHFGRAENILAPGVGKNMGDGWETRRSRGKNFDWIIIKCSSPGKINKIQLDTHHFKGNYPDKCSVQATYIPNKISEKNFQKLVEVTIQRVQ